MLSVARVFCRWPKNGTLIRRHFERQANSGLNNSNPSSLRLLVKPLIFSVGFCGCSFVGASIWQYESTRSRTSKRHAKAGEWRNQIYKWWSSQSDGFKVFFGILLTNTAVFVCWKIPRLQNVMVKHFASSASSNSLALLPMVLSTFSHTSFVHLALNMFVFYSFSNIAAHDFGKEQFLGIYLSSGVAASFLSYAHKVLTKNYSAVSLGASGAILGILATSCMLHPDIQLMIVFLPFFSIPASLAFKGLVTFDLAGVLFRWQFFDHAAHLGGSLFGIWYAWYGNQTIWENRIKLIKKWHEIRKGWTK